MTTRSDTFRALHRSGTFVMPNPWDVGSARYLAWRGFPALATTSSGLAAALGRMDQSVGRDELAAHVEQLASAVDVPINVDAERCYPDDPGGIEATVAALASAGAAGLSIEDYDPATGQIDDLAIARDRVAVAAAACAEAGVVLTARTERHLYDSEAVLDDTIERLSAFIAAGAEVVYAPGVITAADVGRLVDGVGAPVNVLAMRGSPTVVEMEAIGVRRISTGGALAWAALGGLRDAADDLDRGVFDYLDRGLGGRDRAAAFETPTDTPS